MKTSQQTNITSVYRNQNVLIRAVFERAGDTRKVLCVALSPPSAPAQRRLEGPRAKSNSKHSPLIQRRDALQAGVSSTALTRLTREGVLLHVGRGLYQLAEVNAPSPELVDVSLRHPKAVIVLISALAYHAIGTQRSSEVWVQLPINAPTPGTKWPPLRIVRSPLDKAFTEGVDTHQIGGYPVRITSVDRTIVDCFKHRSLGGLDVAIEALRERMKQRSGENRSLQNRHRYSRLMRVSRIMQPYMKAMLCDRRATPLECNHAASLLFQLR